MSFIVALMAMHTLIAVDRAVLGAATRAAVVRDAQRLQCTVRIWPIPRRPCIAEEGAVQALPFGSMSHVVTAWSDAVMRLSAASHRRSGMFVSSLQIICTHALCWWQHLS